MFYYLSICMLNFYLTLIHLPASWQLPFQVLIYISQTSLWFFMFCFLIFCGLHSSLQNAQLPCLFHNLVLISFHSCNSSSHCPSLRNNLVHAPCLSCSDPPQLQRTQMYCSATMIFFVFTDDIYEIHTDIIMMWRHWILSGGGDKHTHTHKYCEL